MILDEKRGTLWADACRQQLGSEEQGRLAFDIDKDGVGKLLVGD